jgi:hypothetical protein
VFALISVRELISWVGEEKACLKFNTYNMDIYMFFIGISKFLTVTGGRNTEIGNDESYDPITIYNNNSLHRHRCDKIEYLQNPLLRSEEKTKEKDRETVAIAARAKVDWNRTGAAL